MPRQPRRRTIKHFAVSITLTDVSNGMPPADAGINQRNVLPSPDARDQQKGANSARVFADSSRNDRKGQRNFKFKKHIWHSELREPALHLVKFANPRQHKVCMSLSKHSLVVCGSAARCHVRYVAGYEMRHIKHPDSIACKENNSCR